MKAWSNFSLAGVLCCLIAGCSANRDLTILSPAPEGKGGAIQEAASRANQDLIVLLPDPNGKVGAIRVTTTGGFQTLDQPRFATRVEDSRKPPTTPQPIDASEITFVFGEALSAQPDLTGRFISFNLWFKNDTTKLTHESRELLPEVVSTIKNRKSNEIYVVGHADRVGTEVYNTGLSSRRADYVRDFLVFYGIESSAIVVSFHGEARLLVPTEDEVAEPLNRRVEVIIR